MLITGKDGENNPRILSDVHFNDAVKMHQETPQKLNELREQEIKRLIDSAPEEMRRKLLGLQFKVDAAIRTSKTPLQSCVKISGMMRESLETLNDVLQGRVTLEPVQDKPKADILPFHIPL